MPVPVPDHLPDRLTITLWDFSWYTRTGEGEPFADLDAAFSQAVDRGYNTVRICAMPYLLFGSGLDTTALHLTRLGGDYGQRTRWYDVGADAVLDGRAHLLELFRAAERHDCFVIVSSWEYQQSPAFLAHRSWSDALLKVPPAERPAVLARSHAELIEFLTKHGLDDRIAFTELHNEVQFGHLTDDLEPGTDYVVGLQDRLETAIDLFHELAPGRLVAMNYARVPVGSMRGIARNADVAVFHPYVYGVLDELYSVFALRRAEGEFPEQRARTEILRVDAPDLKSWLPPEDARWRLRATIVSQREIYAHDWCDPEKWDRWLYSRYGEHKHEMKAVLNAWLLAARDWSLEHGVPVVFGEGWVGDTPLQTTFQEGPVGAQICRDAVRQAGELGAWGAVVCSHAAPHHPMWDAVELQREINSGFLENAR